MRSETAWQAVLAELALQLTQATFDTWLRDSVLLREEDGTLVVGVKNAYAKDWLENRLLGTVKRTLARLTGGPVDVRFEIRPQEEEVGRHHVDRSELGLGPEVETVVAPREIDRDMPPECRVSVELINFDPRDQGFVMFSIYGLQFWKP